MKRRWYAVVLAALLLNSTMVFAQRSEKSNPYEALGKAPYIIGADRENELKSAIFVIENANGKRLEHNPQTGKARLFDKEGVLIKESELKPGERAWWVPDPKAEKYYNTSPYAYVANNPMKYIDPNGMDIYRFDNKTGEFALVIRNDDNFDQVGKFNFNKKTGEYTLKTNRKGEARTQIDNVEKGILSDGVNFKMNDNLIQVGGEGQATVGGVEAFVLRLSELAGNEIGGAYFSANGDNNIDNSTHMTIGRYKNNDMITNRGGHGHLTGFRAGMNKDNLTAFFHTHPTIDGDQTNRFRESDTDIKSRNNALEHKPTMQFFILTAPQYYGGRYPHRFSY